MKISTCIDMMFADMAFEDRIGAAHACGMDAVEFWKWTNKDIDRVTTLLNENEMKLSVFNIDSRDETLSYDLSRGILNAGRKKDLLTALQESAPVYHKLGAAAMIVLIGETLEEPDRERQEENVRDCLSFVAPYAEAEGITLIVEPLNATDRKNYFMPEAARLFRILDDVNSPNVKMLYDIYHQHMTGDFDLALVREKIGRIGHFHIADCPGRHEPGTGCVNYPSILREILKTGYDGYFGLEYRATVPDAETFGFLGEV